MKISKQHIVWTAVKNFDLQDTLSRNKPPELITGKTTEEIPQNIKFSLAKGETSPRVACEYAVKTVFWCKKKLLWTFHYISWLPKQPLWSRFIS